MPAHDWTLVEAGIFHDFHHEWIGAIKRALNSGILPPDYYALVEQQAAGYTPDVLTLQGSPEEGGGTSNGAPGVKLAQPRARFTAETPLRPRRKSTVAVRHVSEDNLVAIVEIVSPGNKGSKNEFKAFRDKVRDLLAKRIHLLLIDLHPPTKRDPRGLHSAIWEDITDEEFVPPADKPLTLVAYESGPTLRAYIEPVAVGDALLDMPLFLEPGAHVLVPLESTYQTAFDAVPRRWRSVLQPPS